MKLLTFDTGTGPRAGVLSGDTVLDAASLLGESRPLRDVQALLDARVRQDTRVRPVIVRAAARVRPVIVRAVARVRPTPHPPPRVGRETVPGSRWRACAGSGSVQSTVK